MGIHSRVSRAPAYHSWGVAGSAYLVVGRCGWVRRHLSDHIALLVAVFHTWVAAGVVKVAAALAAVAVAHGVVAHEGPHVEPAGQRVTRQVVEVVVSGVRHVADPLWPTQAHVPHAEPPSRRRLAHAGRGGRCHAHGEVEHA